MRLLDLIHPYGDELSKVVDATPGPVRLRPYLPLEGLAYERLDEPGPGVVFPAGAVALAMFGPDPDTHGTLADVLALIPCFQAGALGVIIMADEVEDAPLPLLLDALVRARCQILQVADLDYQLLRAAVVFRRVEVLHRPRDFFGQGDDAPTQDADAQFMLAVQAMNSYLVSGFMQRSLQAKHRGLQVSLDVAQQRIVAASASSSALQTVTGEKAALARQVAKLESENQRLRSEVNLRTRRLQQMEGSRSLQVGRALVDAARSPARGTVVLPKRLLELWRGRGAQSLAKPAERAGRPEEPAPSVAQAVDPIGDARYLRHVTLRAAPQRRLSIGVVAPEDTVMALSAAAEVTELLPHDGVVLVGSVQPDVVLVDSAAGRPGHAWASLGRPEAVDVNRRLIAIAEAAELHGIPVVITRMRSAEAPALEGLVPGAALRLSGAGWPDAPLAWTAGIQLGRFNPLRMRPAMGGSPAILLDGRPLLDGEPQWVTDVIARADELGLTIYIDVDNLRHDESSGQGVPIGPGDRDAVFRRHPVFLAAPHGQFADAVPTVRTIEQLACGATVVAPAPLDGWLSPRVRAPGDDGLDATLGDAARAGPAGVAERLPLLREIFADLSTTVAVRALVERLGLGEAHTHPRSIAVVAEIDGAETLRVLIDDLLSQRSRPDELWVAMADDIDGDGGLEELAGAGISVQVERTWSDESARRRLGRGRTSWVGLWDQRAPWGEHGLSDLLLGAELSGAAMISRGGAWRPVVDAPAKGSLLRREMVASDIVPLVGNLEEARLGDRACRGGHMLLGI